MAAYQSPICLDRGNIRARKQGICIEGENTGAKYNEESKIFEIQDDIILQIDSIQYKMLEYHFHIPGEHKVHGDIHKSEIHYVFVELNSQDSNIYECPDVCGCNFHFGDISGNILVIGRIIKPSDRKTDVYNVQVDIPNKFFEYDGTLTTGNYSPVRWIVGCNSIHMNICEIEPYHKPARPLQPLDGRIILHTD